ncbi:hypothetical protein SDC9_175060 [bioreactor metagenome]|uniref:Uncharacterized protein n=1 Tax=bioreactor metagenome TaxID=1076179 RepID=A0A645GN67_9ZZZZ
MCLRIFGNVLFQQMQPHGNVPGLAVTVLPNLNGRILDIGNLLIGQLFKGAVLKTIFFSISNQPQPAVWRNALKARCSGEFQQIALGVRVGQQQRQLFRICGGDGFTGAQK